jgi:DNA-binding transcriptional LysR family regulator
MIRSLLDRKIDLLVAHYRAEEKRLKMRYMGKKEIVLVAAAKSAFVEKEPLSIRDLEKIPTAVRSICTRRRP